MVLISEIMEDAKKKEGEPKEADGEQEDEEKAEEGLQEERDETEERSQEPAAVDRAELAAPPAEDPKKEASPPSGKMLYNDYALRVAYIMQSYLYMRQGGAAASGGESSGGGPAGEERCRAMMEVVRKESGRWAVSRVVLEHTHPREPPPDPADIAAVSPSCLSYLRLTSAPSMASPMVSTPPTTTPSPPTSAASTATSPSSSPNLHARFYHGFCKHYLWPLLHYLLPLSPSSLGGLCFDGNPR